MKIIVFLNGEYNYNNNFFEQFIMKDDIIYCADGGAIYAHKYGLLPKYIIGDLDSIDLKILDFYKEKNVLIEKYPCEKDYTDFELVLQKIEKEHSEYEGKIYVLGGLGKRMDMTLSNLALMEEHKNLVFVNGDEKIYYTDKSVEILDKKNYEFSIVLIDEVVESLTLKGFKYEVENKNFERKNSTLVSNIITSNKAIIKFNKGKMLFFIKKG